MKKPLIALSCAAALLLAGCSAPAPAPAPAGTTAPGTTASSTPAAPAASGLVPGAEVDKAALSQELEAAQKNIKTLHMEMTTKANAAGTDFTMGMSGDMDVSNPAAPKGRLALTGPIAMEMIMDGGDIFYIKMPLLGEGWYKATQEELGAQVPDAAEQTNLYREFLTKAEKVTYVGEETVDGEKTRHYTLLVPTSTVSKDAAGDTPVPVSLYVNEQGWVKRTQLELADPVMSLDLTMSKFNEPVAVEIPADAQPFPKR